MQLSGSFLQSVLHLNLSHANHPIGGVSANPFSSALQKFIIVNVQKSTKQTLLFLAILSQLTRFESLRKSSKNLYINYPLSCGLHVSETKSKKTIKTD